uniref:Uncharacterized protein n=1 Tax=Amphimedon queenslandica TaxID=400682 RepID=A0A1X7SX83_AMPQE
MWGVVPVVWLFILMVKYLLVAMMGLFRYLVRMVLSAVRRIGSKGNGNGQFGWPWGLLLAGDRLYVSDNNLHHVQYFSATTGQYIGQFGSNGNGNG